MLLLVFDGRHVKGNAVAACILECVAASIVLHAEHPIGTACLSVFAVGAAQVLVSRFCDCAGQNSCHLQYTRLLAKHFLPWKHCLRAG